MSGSGDAAKSAWVERVLGFAVSGDGQAQAQGLDKADRLAGEDSKSLVNYRKALLAFDTAKKNVDQQIEALADKIAAVLPDEADFAQSLHMVLATFNDKVADAVDAAMNTAQESRAGANEAAVRTIEQYIKEIDTSALVAHVDRNPFMPTRVGAILKTALNDIVATIV
jgi:hypothetical protein